MWPMKVECEVKFKLKCEMIRWICGLTLNDRKKNAELGDLIGLEPVSLVTRKGRLGCFKHKDVLIGSNIGQ